MAVAGRPARLSRALARSLPEPVSANRTADVEVLCRAGGAPEVGLVTPPALTNVIGSPQPSGTAARGLLPSRPGNPADAAVGAAGTARPDPDHHGRRHCRPGWHARVPG